MRRTCEIVAKIDSPSAIIIDESYLDVKKPQEWAREIPEFPGSKVFLTSKLSSASIYSILKVEKPKFEALYSKQFPGILAIFDQLESTVETLTFWAQRGITPLLLDDSGPARKVAPFVLDAIPGPRGTEANQSSINFLNLPPRCNDLEPGRPILISFGSDDPARLSVRVASGIIDEIGINPSELQVTLPGNVPKESFHQDMGILYHPNNLKLRLAEYSLLICSYGLTMWEAISVGIPVITVEPTKYHAKLSRKLKIPSIGFIEPGSLSLPRRKIVQLRRLMNSPSELRGIVSAIGDKYIDRSLGYGIDRLLNLLEVPTSRCCACEALLPPVIARFPYKTYYYCPRCHVTGLYSFISAPKYTSEYFGRQYKKQYGRSYLEDFEYIKTLAIPRLQNISLRAKKGANLLDIGCAYGSFLMAAQETGYRPYGTDISEDAISYIRENLGMGARAGIFPSEELITALPLSQYEIITLWYMAEHFPDLREALRAINRLLPIGGILALSTPNGKGVSGRLSPRRFLENSPVDHYSIWDPGFARRLLAKHGFRTYKIRITGHHPERILPCLRPNSLLFRIIHLLSRLLRLGDTFEIYATKERADA